MSVFVPLSIFKWTLDLDSDMDADKDTGTNNMEMDEKVAIDMDVAMELDVDVDHLNRIRMACPSHFKDYPSQVKCMRFLS
jgi:hypothetical protein